MVGYKQISHSWIHNDSAIFPVLSYYFRSGNQKSSNTKNSQQNDPIPMKQNMNIYTKTENFQENVA